MGVGEDIYTGTADFGRAYSIFSAILATFIGIIFVIAGIYGLYKTPSDQPRGGFWLAIGLGIFIIIISWIFVWLAQRYKAFAAFEGVSGGLNILSHIR